jgi:hypothetical protein
MNAPPNLGQTRAGFTLDAVFRDLSKQRREIKTREPFETAALIGGLLTVPDLHSACLRLEGLAHVVVAVASGPRVPKIRQIAPWFHALGRGMCGTLEDPPEDAFVSLAHDGSGNYRLFGGIWEANAYYAQIFLRVLETMLPVDPYGTLHRQVLALLKLSELVAERAGTERHILGHGGRVTTLPQSLLDRTDEVRSRVMFGDADLAPAGVSRADLEPFVFSVGYSGDLLRQAIGHSHLERRPLMASEETLALVLPTAVGAAVRRHVIETCRALGQGDRLMRAIAQANAERLAETILLGEKQDIPITFSSFGTYGIFDCDLPLHQGHVIHFVLFAGNLDRYDQGGLDGFNTDEALRARINTSIAAARRRYEQRPGFRQGLSLVVSCGWGRGFGAGDGASPSGCLRPSG